MYTKLLVVWVLEPYPWLSIHLQSSILKWPTALCVNFCQGHVSPYHLPQSDTVNGKLNWLNWPMLIVDWLNICWTLKARNSNLCYTILNTHVVMCIIFKLLYCCLCMYCWLIDMWSTFTENCWWTINLLLVFTHICLSWVTSESSLAFTYYCTFTW